MGKGKKKFSLWLANFFSLFFVGWNRSWIRGRTRLQILALDPLKKGRHLYCLIGSVTLDKIGNRGYKKAKFNSSGQDKNVWCRYSMYSFTVKVLFCSKQIKNLTWWKYYLCQWGRKNKLFYIPQTCSNKGIFMRNLKRKWMAAEYWFIPGCCTLYWKE